MSPTCILSLNLKNIIFFQKKGKENRSLVHDYWLIGLVGGWVGGGGGDIRHDLKFTNQNSV